jgi:hypothetical protein
LVAVLTEFVPCALEPDLPPQPASNAAATMEMKKELKPFMPANYAAPAENPSTS